VVPGAGLSGRIVTASSSGAPILVCIHGGCFDHSYFDFPHSSFLAAAEEAGVCAVAVDRPGYGASPRPEEFFDFRQQAARIDDAVAAIWSTAEIRATSPTGVVVVGHSIGSAVAISLAARQPSSWPLRGLLVSGIHERTPVGSLGAYPDIADGARVELDDDDARGLMLGPGGSYEQAASEALPEFLRPLWIDDFRGVTRTWPDEFRVLAPQVTCPVRIAVAGFDPLITPTVEALGRSVSLFESSPFREPVFIQGSGHCIDFHKVGGEFQRESIAFALKAGASREVPWRGLSDERDSRPETKEEVCCS